MYNARSGRIKDLSWWWVSKTKLFVFTVLAVVIVFLLLDLVSVPLAFVPKSVLLILAAVIFILLTKVVDRACAKG